MGTAAAQGYSVEFPEYTSHKFEAMEEVKEFLENVPVITSDKDGVLQTLPLSDFLSIELK